MFAINDVSDLSKLKAFEDVAWENIEDLGMSENNDIERGLLEEHDMHPNMVSQLEIDDKEDKKLDVILKQIEGFVKSFGGHNMLGKYLHMLTGSHFYSANAKFLFEKSHAL